jgi:LPXTG-site transpeptidase (sortase) family protein
MRATNRRTLARAAIAAALLMSGLATIVSPAAGTPLSAAATPAGASIFTAIAPSRLVDTRVPTGATPAGTPGDNGTITVQITNRAGIPANATAVVLNVTATNTTGPGFVTAYPAGQALPLASNLNPERAGQNIPNLVTAPIGTGGQIVVYTLTKADIIVDAFGYYTPAPLAKAGRYVPAGPVRAYDSRPSRGPLAAGETVNVPLDKFIDKDATAVVLNVTATDATDDGFYTVFAAGTTRPPTSNLNVVKGGTVPNQVIVPVSKTGVDIYAFAGGHVIVDVFGYFTGASAPSSDDGLYVPVPPTRFLDTRTDDNPLGPKQRLFAGWTAEMNVIGRSNIPYSVSALVANTTVVNTRDAGFTTVYPAGTPRPLTSNLNATESAQLIANHTIVPVGVRGIAFYTQKGSHIVVDVTGWYTGTPQTSSLTPPTNPTPAPPPLPTRIVVPRLNLDTGLAEANGLDDLFDFPGYLPGSGLTGSPGNMVIAGHRTSHTHPFLFIDALQPGDEFYVYADGKYTYKVQGSVVVPGSDYNTIVAWTPQPTVTLYACHPPGSTAERWVVKAAYVGDT